MKNGSGVVHFTIGGNFGITLAEIARDTLFYDMNPEKAMNVYRESLMGITDEQIYPLLNSEMVIEVDVENQMCEIVKRDESHIDYPETININEFLIQRTKELVELVYTVMGAFTRFTQTRNSINFDIDIPISKIVKFVNAENDINDLFGEYLDLNDEFGELETIIKIYRDTITNGFKLINLYRFLNKIYKFDVESDEYSFNLDTEIKVCNGYLINMHDELLRCIDNQSIVNIENDELSKYIDSVIKNDKILSDKIQPVNILDGYDAGWLSPKGEFYGLNGSIANMLHITISVALQRKGVIPKDETNQSLWLDENGWVKLHHDNVNFGGYQHSNIFSNKPIFMTDKQIDAVYKYGQTKCNGLLKVGYLLEPMSAAKFRMFAEADSEKLYELF